MEYFLATVIISAQIYVSVHNAQSHRHNEHRLCAAKSQIINLIHRLCNALAHLYVQDMGTPDLISAPVMAREAGIESIISTVSTYTLSAIV